MFRLNIISTLRSVFAPLNHTHDDKVDKVSGKGLSTNDYTTAEKNKLAAITESADAVGYSQTSGSSVSGVYEIGKITINGTATTIYGKDTNNTYSAVGTTGNPGLMTAADKTKLDGIATGATKTVVDSALDSSSTNPVQNEVINTALGNKVDKVSGKGLSTNDYTTAEKNKLAGVTESADAVSYSQTVASSASGAYEVGKITINGTATTIYGKDTNTTYSAVGTSGDPGLMTAADKVKLNNITESADAVGYSQTSGSSVSGVYEIGKITINGTATTIYGKDTNTTYSAVGTTGNAGLMTAADKVKLNNITESADAVSYSQTVASSTSGAYEVGKITINGTATTIYGKDTNTTYSAVGTSGDPGLMTAADKVKLNNIATGATKTSFSYTNGVLTINNE